MSTSPQVISGDSLLHVWRQAYALLETEGDKNNLILHINRVDNINESELLTFDPNKIKSGANKLLDVANTIFPKKNKHWDKSVEQFSGFYKKSYETLLRRGRRSWGCYFLRLISFGTEDINQLDRIIKGLGSWGRSHKAAFVVHFSASTTDKPRPLGAPCLQYVQFGVSSDNRLNMTAVYRSHDYFNKTLGNLLGLTRLLEYVAYKTDHETGSLTCVSSYAFIAEKRVHKKAMIRGVCAR